MKVSVSEAARLAGISRQHMYTKYIKQGLLSVDRDDPGKPMIDTAELIRIFPSFKLPDSYMSSNRHDLTGETSSKITALDAEARALRELLTASQERERWLQQQVDKLTDTLKMIEYRPAPDQADQPPAEAPRRGFWSRLFGGAA